jgi:hypothetical protein
MDQIAEPVKPAEHPHTIGLLPNLSMVLLDLSQPMAILMTSKNFARTQTIDFFPAHVYRIPRETEYFKLSFL